MTTAIQFKVEQKIPGALGRAGILTTPHGVIHTPAFVSVGTKATVKALTPEQVQSLGAEVVLTNTYHLYFQPGAELVKQSGGLGKFMNWDKPTMTDSGGFQVFSLGAAFDRSVSKLGSTKQQNPAGFTHLLAGSDADQDSAFRSAPPPPLGEARRGLIKIDDDGVTFRSPLDGRPHRFTPEKSIQIQHDLGADIIFAFDECTSPLADYDYQKSALNRTHRWAERSLAEHQKLLRSDLKNPDVKGPTFGPGLFGIVQGGRHQDLREASARVVGGMDFAGFGIGGSFTKEDIATAVGWVNRILPEDKPRHLLGIGEPGDMIAAIEQGVDTFDCVMPTRLARNGTLMTVHGRLNILNAQYRNDLSPIEEGCQCYTCLHYTRAYLAHLFRAKEMLAATLASIHNLYFTIHFVKQIRQAILDGSFDQFKTKFLQNYQD